MGCYCSHLLPYCPVRMTELSQLDVLTGQMYHSVDIGQRGILLAVQFWREIQIPIFFFPCSGPWRCWRRPAAPPVDGAAQPDDEQQVRTTLVSCLFIFISCLFTSLIAVGAPSRTATASCSWAPPVTRTLTASPAAAAGTKA